MALVFCDGFEQYSTTVDFSNSGNYGQFATAPSTGDYGWISATGATVLADTAIVRTTQTGTGKSLKVSSSSLLCKMPSPGTLIVGFGFRISSLSSIATIATFSSSGFTTTDLGLKVRVLTNGALSFYNELTNAVIVSSAAGAIAVNTWYHVELKIIFGLVGFVEARINETAVCSASLVDTLCGSTSARCFHLMNSVAGASAYFDDLYLCDDTGANNNNYLGSVRIFTLFPTANGATNDFSVTGAASNFAALNTTTHDSSSYTTSSTSGAKDLFEVQDLPASPVSVAGVVTAARVQDQNGRPANTRELGIRTGGSEQYGSPLLAATGSWVNIRQVFEKQADGVTPWDGAAVNNMQIGIRNS